MSIIDQPTPWRETTLGAEVDFITGFPFKSEQYTDAADGTRLLRGDNIIQGSLRWDGVKRWPKEKSTDHESYLLHDGDIVLAMDRPWIDAGLKFAAITAFDLPAFLVQRVARLRGGAKLDSRFLRYIVKSAAFTQHILAVQTGTAVPHISGKQIREFEFLCPPPDEQRAIARVLGDLDDKIELNRRMNATLETMAQVLFKSWFVDFDPVRAKAEGRIPEGMDVATASLFPQELVDSDLGESPDGWQVRKIGDLITLRMDRVEADESKNSLPYIGLEDMPSKSINLSTFRPGTEVNSSIIAFQEGDMLFGSMRPYFHKVGLAQFDGITRTTTFVLRPNEETYRYFALMHLFSDAVIEFSTAHSVGTTIPYVKWESLADYELIAPPVAVLEIFNSQIAPWLERIAIISAENLRLAATRDKLLPELLSGRKRIPH